MINSIFNVILDKSEAHPGQDSVWEYHSREDGIPAFYGNVVNGQRITLSRKADEITKALQLEEEPMVFGTGDPRVVGLSYNTAHYQKDSLLLSMNSNTLNTRFITDAEAENHNFHINQVVDYGPYGLVYINVNRKDYKVISYRTSMHTDTINTYRYKNLVGMLISVFPPQKAVENKPILDIVLKDLSTNKFVRYIVDYDDEGVIKISEKYIGGKKFIARYREYDEKFRNGARFKVRFNTYKPGEAEITGCKMIWNPDSKELSGGLSDPQGEAQIQIGVSEYVRAIDDPNLLNESDWVDVIGSFVEIMSNDLKTKVNAITIDGFDIPRSVVYQLKQLVYIFKVDEENNRYITIKSR